MTKKRKAHTLVELIIIVVILGVLAFIAVPRLRFAAIYRKQADTVARKIVTDLRRTRGLAISSAATNTGGFSLSISKTGLIYEIKIADSNGTTIPNGTFSIDSKIITCSPCPISFQFGPLGNLTGSDSQLEVSANEKIFTISITPATGMIKCTEN